MSLMSQFEIRKRCIKALMVREAKKRFGLSFGGLAMAFFEPMVQVMFFGALFYFTNRETPHGSDIFVFMVSGVIPYHLFSKTFTKAMTGIDANRTLLSYPILKPIDTIISRVILEVMIYLIVFALLIAVSIHLELISGIARPFYLIIGTCYAAAFGCSAAILFAAAIAFWKPWQKIAPLIIRLGFFTSGVFFSSSMLPQIAKDIFWWNPMLHVTEIIRHGIFLDFPDKYFNILFPFLCFFSILSVGIALLDIAQRSPRASVRNN